MRIVIDMQGAQAENRTRGIGRYTTAITKAIIRNSGTHEIILALNGLFSETIEQIRAEFNSIIDQKNIRVWYTCTPTRHIDKENDNLRNIAELTYEAFLAEQNPDFIYVSSLFEGLVDDAVTSVHKLQNIAPVAVTLYDLIPYINPNPYLENPSVKRWYLDKIEHIKQADVWLAISESSRQEGIIHLGLDPTRTQNISTDADAEFTKIEISPKTEQQLRQKYNLTKPFLMYTGGIDHRKNIEGLIRAYAKLPDNVKNNHQVAIVCSVQPESRTALKNLSGQLGLNDEDLILTGFVPSEDLVALYNICHLFIFPSWHEGFGLPALEAMRCGAPVIGANTSSLPEVIGWEHALFDPRSDTDMAAVIEKGLTDKKYRTDLLTHQREQEKKFSWDESAKRAISAMEQWSNAHEKNITSLNPPQKKIKLAYISPLPPARTGIADYSAELLPELSKYYDIDAIVEQDEPVDKSLLPSNLKIRNSTWLIKNRHLYDRVLYHFGNSSFHQHMFELLEKVPGIVVLHDFFLSGIQAHRDLSGIHPGAWAIALFESHGYPSVFERFTAKDTADVVWKYPANLPIIQRAKGLITHSDHSIELIKNHYDISDTNHFKVIPLARSPANTFNKEKLRIELGIAPDDIVICSFGVIGKTKLNDRLLNAWLNSPLKDNKNAHLIFVGQGDNGEYHKSLQKNIKASCAKSNIKITGWVDEKDYKKYLTVADIGVQLRTLSRGETSAAVLDCMNYSLATIANAHGSMKDLDPSGVWLIDENFTDSELANALNDFATNPELRSSFGSSARNIIRTKHHPENCAKQYFSAIEIIYKKETSGLHGLIQEFFNKTNNGISLQETAITLAKSFPPKTRQKQLLVDISELVQRDAKSGIQRVVRAILQQWLINPPDGYRVEPIYAEVNSEGYRYARRFTCDFMDIPYIGLEDDPVDAWQGDAFIGLDLQPNVVPAQISFLKNWRNNGIAIWFVVYDLLPILHPQYFYPGAELSHTKWLRAISEFDGAVCISKAVASEFQKWISEQKEIENLRPIKVEWFHLGADVSASVPSSGVSSDLIESILLTSELPIFLMVGTIEPRKGHAQVLDAFEKLWAAGIDVKLVIIGKQGWMVEELIERLRNHLEASRKLFWLEGISDEYLEKVYEKSTCLIAASYAEGFGLPLIEAAQHRTPIIARDIPVFREVAGDNAFYFNTSEPDGLAKAIQKWLDLYIQRRHVSSDNLPWFTWSESSENLKKIILKRAALDEPSH